MPKFSVSMPTLNRADYLELTLEGYTLQTLDDFELVIVNDGGEDHTDDVVRSHSSRVLIPYIRQENMGRAAARNTALSNAGGEIWVFNDDDRIPMPGFLKAHGARLPKGTRLISVGRKMEVLSIYHPDLRLETDERSGVGVSKSTDVEACTHQFFGYHRCSSLRWLSCGEDVGGCAKPQ